MAAELPPGLDESGQNPKEVRVWGQLRSKSYLEGLSYILPDFTGRFTGPAFERAGKRTHLGEAQHERDFGQGLAPVLDVLFSKVFSHLGEQLLERSILLLKFTVHVPRRCMQFLCDHGFGDRAI